MRIFHLSMIALVSGFVFPAIASYEAVYVTLAAMVLAVALQPRLALEAANMRPFFMISGGFLLIGLGLPFVWSRGDDLVILLLLVPILLAPGMAVLLRSSGLDRPEMVGGFALAGSFAGLGFGLYDLLVNGTARVGVGNNPIHYASICTIIGFLALLGLYGSDKKTRFVVLLGPVNALICILISGSRGPLLSFLLLSLALAPVLLRRFWREKIFRRSVVAALAMVGASTLALLAWGVQGSGGLGLFTTLFTLADGGPLDASSQIRAIFWQSGWAAFSQSPLVGHGASQIYAAAAAHFPPGFAAQYDVHPVHLHADLLDFGVAGGVLGLAGLALVLAAPLTLWSRHADPDMRAMLATGGIVLTLGYFTLGLTNATIGILPQTALFGVGLGALMALARPSRPT